MVTNLIIAIRRSHRWRNGNLCSTKSLLAAWLIEAYRNVLSMVQCRRLAGFHLFAKLFHEPSKAKVTLPRLNKPTPFVFQPVYLRSVQGWITLLDRHLMAVFQEELEGVPILGGTLQANQGG